MAFNTSTTPPWTTLSSKSTLPGEAALEEPRGSPPDPPRVLLPRHPVHSRRGFAAQPLKRLPERAHRDAAKERRKPCLLSLLAGCRTRPSLTTGEHYTISVADARFGRSGGLPPPRWPVSVAIGPQPTRRPRDIEGASGSVHRRRVPPGVGGAPMRRRRLRPN